MRWRKKYSSPVLPRASGAALARRRDRRCFGIGFDPPCRPKRRGGRWRDILHAPIRVEGGKMKRYIRTEPFPNPSAQGLNLGC
jgi:hypothetical protein